MDVSMVVFEPLRACGFSQAVRLSEDALLILLAQSLRGM